VGDRCNIYVWCSLRTAIELDLAHWPGGWDEEAALTDHDKKMLAKVEQYEDDGVNYGLIGERETASKNGHVFVGWHGDGGSYNGAAFASDGKKHAEVELVNGGCVVRLALRNGEAVVRAREMSDARAYLSIWRAAAKKLGVTGNPFTGEWELKEKT
jgi:hypothetical protein